MLRLSMSEGLATYLGTAAQLYCAQGLGLPRVGDEYYHSVNGVEENFDQYCYGRNLTIGGECNEGSVTSLLIKMMDDVERPSDDVVLGHSAMWSYLRSKNHWCISELVKTILDDNADLRSSIGLILEKEGFSAYVLTPARNLSTDPTDECWSFRWQPNGFESVQPNQFNLVFEGEDTSYRIESITETTRNLTSEEIDEVLSLKGSSLKWHLESYNDRSPLTGGYVSEDVTLCKPVPLILVNSRTSSFSLLADQKKWLTFMAPYSGTFHFESQGSLDVKGELFGNFVSDGSTKGLISYDDDSGEGTNFLLTKALEKGESVYLRVSGFSSSAVGECSISVTADHVHSYSYSFVSYSSTKHKAYCSCGLYVLKKHSSNGAARRLGSHLYTNCADCGQLIDLNETTIGTQEP